MRKHSIIALVGLCAALAALSAGAADAPAAASPPVPAASAAPLVETADAAPGTPEPVVKRTVIEDRGARIEELRVRGQLQKVTVDLKGHAPNYEILLGDGAHVFAEDPGTSRGSAGKRVWNILRF